MEELKSTAKWIIFALLFNAASGVLSTFLPKKVVYETPENVIKLMEKIEERNKKVEALEANEKQLINAIHKRDSAIYDLVIEKDGVAQIVDSVLADDFETATAVRRDSMINEALNNIP
jgi:hypothetical protein